MKLLFINSKSPDYVEDQLFSALTELLGKKSVVSYPVNYRYYIKRKSYPLNMGRCRTASDFIKDKLALKKELRAFDYDYVIIGSTKQDTFENFSEIERFLPKNIPLIFVMVAIFQMLEAMQNAWVLSRYSTAWPRIINSHIFLSVSALSAKIIRITSIRFQWLLSRRI